MKYRSMVIILIATVVMLLGATAVIHPAQTQAASTLQQATGKLTFLRVHNVGTQYGPPTDQIDVEVVMGLDSKPGMAFGFQLRNDTNALARQGQLDLLRDAFNHNWTVRMDYSIETGKKNGTIIRTTLTR
jgi:hypothetical protein